MSFKVGDRVVAKNGDSRIFNFRDYLNGGRIHLIFDGEHYAYPMDWFRPATPEEIAAGHRIDANTDYVTDIRNHISPMTIVQGDL